MYKYSAPRLIYLWRNSRLLHCQRALQLQGAIGADTCISLIKQCATLRSLKTVHASMLRSLLHQNLCFFTNLISHYASLGSISYAFSLFYSSASLSFLSDVFLWNVIIRGFVDNALYQASLLLYSQMRRFAVPPNNFTFPFVLKACGCLHDIRLGVLLHKDVVAFGYESDVFVANSLIAMYGRCKRFHFSRQVFDKMPLKNEVSWSSLIGAYAQNGRFDEGLSLFSRMMDEGIRPTRAAVLDVMACARRQNEADDICKVVMANRFHGDQSVQNAALLMYARCGRIDMARWFFWGIPNKDLVTWTSMIEAYAEADFPLKALELFNLMILQGVISDSVTLLCVVRAGSVLASFQQARVIHGIIIRGLFNDHLELDTAIVDLYVKCGSLASAREVFDRMQGKNLISWSTMISGYGMHGHGREALCVFNQMKELVKPDDITFVSILAACSHSGLLDEGWECFNSMSRDFGVTPGAEHYACMVDLLGRAGRLEEARDLIEKMPVKPNAGVWGALLGACRVHYNVELAELAAESLFELDTGNPGRYVLLSNIYATCGKRKEADKIRDVMKRRGVRKIAGHTIIEIKNTVHTFIAGDRSHAQTDLIYLELAKLMKRIKKEGYCPDLNFVLHDVEEETKEKMLYAHSEKLAIVFGLINLGGERTIRIRKNLRVCGDCHTATKFISKVTAIEIVVRDAHRFHHFKGGICSCGDYW